MPKVVPSECETVVISMCDIDASDNTYRTHAQLVDASLTLSIEEHGLLHPVVVVQCDAKYIVVQGFRRIHVLQKRKNSTVTAFVLKSDGVSRRDLYIQAVHANIGQVFTDADRLLTLKKAKDEFCFTETEIVRSLAGVLSIPQSLKMIADYLQCATVHPLFQSLMGEGKIGYKGIRAISSFSHEDQKLLFRDMFRYCSFSASDVKSLCENIEIVCRRDDISLKELFAKLKIKSVTKENKQSSKNQSNAILQLLQEHARPCVTAMRKEFLRVMQGISLAKNIHIEDPGEFESARYTLSVDFSSAKELSSALSALSKQSDKLQPLFNLDRKMK